MQYLKINKICKFFIEHFFEIIVGFFVSGFLFSCSSGGNSNQEIISSKDTIVRVFDKKGPSVLDSLILDSLFSIVEQSLFEQRLTITRPVTINRFTDGVAHFLPSFLCRFSLSSETVM